MIKSASEFPPFFVAPGRHDREQTEQSRGFSVRETTLAHPLVLVAVDISVLLRGEDIKAEAHGFGLHQSYFAVNF